MRIAFVGRAAQAVSAAARETAARIGQGVRQTRRGVSAGWAGAKTVGTNSVRNYRLASAGAVPLGPTASRIGTAGMWGRGLVSLNPLQAHPPIALQAGWKATLDQNRRSVGAAAQAAADTYRQARAAARTSWQQGARPSRGREAVRRATRQPPTRIPNAPGAMGRWNRAAGFQPRNASSKPAARGGASRRASGGRGTRSGKRDGGRGGGGGRGSGGKGGGR